MLRTCEPDIYDLLMRRLLERGRGYPGCLGVPNYPSRPRWGSQNTLLPGTGNTSSYNSKHGTRSSDGYVAQRTGCIV
jgi:hypothetical protein